MIMSVLYMFFVFNMMIIRRVVILGLFLRIFWLYFSGFDFIVVFWEFLFSCFLFFGRISIFGSRGEGFFITFFSFGSFCYCGSEGFTVSRSLLDILC